MTDDLTREAELAVRGLKHWAAAADNPAVRVDSAHGAKTLTALLAENQRLRADPESDYTDQELARWAMNEANRLSVIHPARGCAGCDRCTQVTMLEIVAIRLDEDEAQQRYEDRKTIRAALTESETDHE